MFLCVLLMVIRYISCMLWLLFLGELVNVCIGRLLVVCIGG